MALDERSVIKTFFLKDDRTETMGFMMVDGDDDDDDSYGNRLFLPITTLRFSSTN